jgi:hypothetical protein
VQAQPFSVQLADAVNFSKVWNYKGIAVPLDELHCQFATDYANIVLRSFVDQMVAKAQLAKQQAEQAAKPLVTLEG